MPRSPRIRSVIFRGLALAATVTAALSSRGASAQETPIAAAPDNRAFILTPPPATAPRINGPRVVGARPGRPFLYRVPATGERPLAFAATGLPVGLTLDSATGIIKGKTEAAGRHPIRVTATNARGTDARTLDIVIGDRISLTPPLGWNSWNCFAGAVDQEKVRAQADAMVRSGLADHGWTYINIDDTWQGARGGPYNAIQGNEKFPDLKGLCDHLHELGLKAGIYSTPWVTSYARHIGGSAENPEGTWTPPGPGPKQVNKKILPWAVGKYHFAKNDAQQWAAWGFDYLKYDWNPIEAADVDEMRQALDASGRDMVLSLSNNAPFTGAADWARLSNCWRTTGDIRDTWKSMSGIGFRQDRWAGFAGPGHWNDPDMLVVGMVGWGKKLHPTQLTPDEQYTHISLWCLLSAPLLIGCDLTQLDPFTLSLLTNDEVLAVDQDELGSEAKPIKRDGDSEVWTKPLASGARAVGLFNRGETAVPITVSWADLGLSGPHPVRDLWRQKDLGPAANSYTATVAPHGVVLVQIGMPHPPAPEK